MSMEHKTPMYSNDLPKDCIVGWGGLSRVLGRSAEALKVSKRHGYLPLTPIKVGSWVFFDIKEVESYVKKIRA